MQALLEGIFQANLKNNSLRLVHKCVIAIII